MAVINGEMCDIKGMTLLEYLNAEGYNTKVIAVEKNGEIVPKAQYENTMLCEEDKVEIVSFVGGG